MQIVVLMCNSVKSRPWQIAVPGEQGEVEVIELDEYLYVVLVQTMGLKLCQ